MSATELDEYRPTEDEPFMNDRQKEYFKQKLLDWKEEILRESLGALELCCPAGRTEDLQASREESVDNAIHQRCLGANDGQPDFIFEGESDQRLEVTDIDVGILDRRFQRGTGIARCDKHGVSER